MALKLLPFDAIIADAQGRVVSFSHIAAAILAKADGGLIAAVLVFSLGPPRSAPRRHLP
jgi:hypothetical protein